MKLLNSIIAAGIMFIIGLTTVWACTSFRLTAVDGTVLIARSMEFAQDMQSNLMTRVQGTPFNTQTANGKTGLSWTAKYGYIFLDSLNLGIPADGMNEEGLSMEALLFPGEAKYQAVPAGEEKQAVSYVHFGDWVLGNFKTVDEVRAALPTIYVFEEKLPELNNAVFPLHYSIFDASGKGIVVEYVEGNLNIHDHMGVMTNAPTYDWQVTNLRNYVQLSPTNPKPVIAKGVTYAATGQGAGMLGLPGDISPPSRFVKMAVMLNTVLQPKTALDALNLSQHMMNNVDIPRGFVRVVDDHNTATMETTQWVIFKDLTHKKLYYRTYDDLTLRAVDLAKLDFSKNAKPLKMSISNSTPMVEVTDQFKAVE